MLLWPHIFPKISMTLLLMCCVLSVIKNEALWKPRHGVSQHRRPAEPSGVESGRSRRASVDLLELLSAPHPFSAEQAPDDMMGGAAESVQSVNGRGRGFDEQTIFLKNQKLNHKYTGEVISVDVNILRR